MALARISRSRDSRKQFLVRLFTIEKDRPRRYVCLADMTNANVF